MRILIRSTGAQKFEDVGHADSQTANARTAPHLSASIVMRFSRGESKDVSLSSTINLNGSWVGPPYSPKYGALVRRPVAISERPTVGEGFECIPAYSSCSRENDPLKLRAL